MNHKRKTRVQQLVNHKKGVGCESFEGTIALAVVKHEDNTYPTGPFRFSGPSRGRKPCKGA